jgi:hypothetical protein
MSVRKLPILPADHRAFVVVHELVSRNHLHYSLGVHGAKMYVMPQLGSENFVARTVQTGPPAPEFAFYSLCPLRHS